MFEPMGCHARHTVCLEVRGKGSGHAVINGDKF